MMGSGANVYSNHCHVLVQHATNIKIEGTCNAGNIFLILSC